ncbi:hypothetical protein SAMN05421754_104221 [Nitrosomonas sp. Nm58]|nr:hypothetical protein SAMN05421754_104221 [Nitrosomonas sp. Nm58]
MRDNSNPLAMRQKLLIMLLPAYIAFMCFFNTLLNFIEYEIVFVFDLNVYKKF